MCALAFYRSHSLFDLTVGRNARCPRTGEHANAWVIVPRGVFLTGKISLASHVYLVLMPGGVLQGSPNQIDYGDDWVRKYSLTHVICPSPCYTSMHDRPFSGCTLAIPFGTIIPFKRHVCIAPPFGHLESVPLAH